MEPEDILKLPGWYKLAPDWHKSGQNKFGTRKAAFSQVKYFHKSNTKWGVWFVDGTMRFWAEGIRVKIPIPESLEMFQEIINQHKPR